jgi:hypothetical protein
MHVSPALYNVKDMSRWITELEDSIPVPLPGEEPWRRIVADMAQQEIRDYTKYPNGPFPCVLVVDLDTDTRRRPVARVALVLQSQFPTAAAPAHDAAVLDALLSRHGLAWAIDALLAFCEADTVQPGGMRDVSVAAAVPSLRQARAAIARP